MIYINVFLITFCLMYVVDKSGIMIDISKFIYQFVNKKEWNGQMIGKPWSCSSCLSFHSIWIYLILFNNFNIFLGLTIAIICSSFLNVILNKIYDKIMYYIFKIK